MIKQIASVLNSRAGESIFQSTYGWAYYMEQFKYLAYAEQEALLRFPNAAQAVNWQWDLCYNLAFSYQGPELGAPELNCYAELIEDGLNTAQTDLSNLPNWFQQHEARFPFEITSQTPPPEFTGSYVITLENSAVLWLAEKSGNYQATGLVSNMFHYRGEAGIRFQLLELTGDNYPELVLYSHSAHCCGSISRQSVYELLSGTPKLLTFKGHSGTFTHLTSEYDSYVTRLESYTEPPGLLFKGHYGNDPLQQACALREYDKYYWNGSQFELADTWLGIEEPGQYDDREFCQFIIDTVKDQGDLDVAVRTIGDKRFDEPDITRTQILYQLGENKARLGHIDKAKEYFSAAVSTAAEDQSSPEWTQSAQTFLDNLQDKKDFYTLCSRVMHCDMEAAFQQLVAQMQPQSFTLAPEVLAESGVAVKFNGFVNFDRSENIEQWLVIQHPNRNQQEFWILVNDSEELYGLFVANVPPNKPELKEFQGSNLYELKTLEGETLFSLEKLSYISQRYIMAHDSVDGHDPSLDEDYLERTLVEQPLNDITNQLFEGIDPTQLREMLLQLKQSPFMNCQRPDRCDRIDYLLGLASELEGDHQAATEIYLQLWQDYPNSFYATMVRSKLEAVPK